MEEKLMVTKIFGFLAIALATAFCAGILVGNERKQRWFKKRTKASFFLRRGIFGESCHFGYPCTKEGYVVTAGMAAVIAGLSAILL